MKRAKAQHWKHPDTKKWDAQLVKNGKILFFCNQGYNREATLLNAIEACTGSRESKRIEFEDRVQ